MGAWHPERIGMFPVKHDEHPDTNTYGRQPMPTRGPSGLDASSLCGIDRLRIFALVVPDATGGPNFKYLRLITVNEVAVMIS